MHPITIIHFFSTIYHFSGILYTNNHATLLKRGSLTNSFHRVAKIFRATQFCALST